MSDARRFLGAQGGLVTTLALQPCASEQRPEMSASCLQRFLQDMRQCSTRPAPPHFDAKQDCVILAAAGTGSTTLFMHFKENKWANLHFKDNKFPEHAHGKNLGHFAHPTGHAARIQPEGSVPPSCFIISLREPAVRLEGNTQLTRSIPHPALSEIGMNTTLDGLVDVIRNSSHPAHAAQARLQAKGAESGMSLDLTALSLGSNYAVPQSSYLVEDNGTWPSCDPAISNITVHFTCLNNIPQDIYSILTSSCESSPTSPRRLRR